MVWTAPGAGYGNIGGGGEEVATWEEIAPIDAALREAFLEADPYDIVDDFGNLTEAPLNLVTTASWAPDSWAASTPYDPTPGGTFEETIGTLYGPIVGTPVTQVVPQLPETLLPAGVDLDPTGPLGGMSEGDEEGRPWLDAFVPGQQDTWWDFVPFFGDEGEFDPVPGSMDAGDVFDMAKLMPMMILMMVMGDRR